MSALNLAAALLIGSMSLTGITASGNLPGVGSVNMYTGVSASKLSAPKGFSVSKKTDTAITLKWNKVSGASGYRVFMFDSKSDEYKKYKDVSGTTCTVTGLKAGRSYKFKVAALVKKNGKATVQTMSSKLSAKTYAYAAMASSELSAPDVKCDVHATYVDFSWNAISGADGYRIYYYDTSKGTYGIFDNAITSCSYFIRDFDPQTSYKFKFVTLKKSNGSYVEQGSSIVSFKTKKYTPKTSPAEMIIPDPGDSIDFSLEISGIADYTLNHYVDENYYEAKGYVLVNGEFCYISLYFNEYGVFGGYDLFIPCDEDYFYNVKNNFVDSLGACTVVVDDYGDEGFQWKLKNPNTVFELKYYEESEYGSCLHSREFFTDYWR